MRIHPRILVLAALASVGTAISLQAEAEVATISRTNACEGCHSRCEICGAEHCCLVPDTKTTKTWVYATKLVPYCRTKCPHPFRCRHDRGDTCPECEECVRYKRVLVKREVVTTKPGYKCLPACGACRARNAAAEKRPAKSAAARPAEPWPLPVSPAPSSVDPGS